MVQDILLGEDYDLLIENGDFVVGDSDQQHLALLIKLAKGSLKQFPLQCVGIDLYSGSTGMAATIKRAIEVAATADGYQNIVTLLSQDSSGVFQYDVTAERK